MLEFKIAVTTPTFHGAWFPVHGRRGHSSSALSFFELSSDRMPVIAM